MSIAQQIVEKSKTDGIDVAYTMAEETCNHHTEYQNAEAEEATYYFSDGSSVIFSTDPSQYVRIGE